MTLLKNVVATCSAESVSPKATQCIRLVMRSTKVMMAWNHLSVRGRCVTKSIAMEPHRRGRSSRSCGIPRCLVLPSFICRHFRHPRQYSSMSFVFPFRWAFLRRASVFADEKCSATLQSWASFRMSTTFFREMQILLLIKKGACFRSQNRKMCSEDRLYGSCRPGRFPWPLCRWGRTIGRCRNS